MSDDVPRPMGRDDQPTDAGDDPRLRDLPPEEIDVIRLNEADAPEHEPDSGLLDPVVEFDDYERTDVDDPAKPGIDDYTD